MLSGDRLIARARQALAVPLPAQLGARTLDAHDPPAGVWFVVDELAGNGAGGLHAAALQIVVEAAGYLALLPHLAAGEHAVTHAASTQFLAAAESGERVEARGVVDRRARRVAFVSVTATVGDRVIARAQRPRPLSSFVPRE